MGNNKKIPVIIRTMIAEKFMKTFQNCAFCGSRPHIVALNSAYKNLPFIKKTFLMKLTRPGPVGHSFENIEYWIVYSARGYYR